MREGEITPDVKQCLILLGAMMVSKQMRDQAVAVLEDNDVAQECRPLWRAIKSGIGADVRGEARKYFLVEEADASCFSALVRNLQQTALSRFCQESVTRVQIAKGIGPEGLLNILDTMSTRIRAKQAALEAATKKQAELNPSP